MEVLFDPGPVLWLQNVLGPAYAEPLRLLSEIGSSWGILLVAALVGWTLGRRRLYLLLALALVLSLTRKAVAAVLGMQRPDGAGIVKYQNVGSTGSLPSGHATTAAGVWAWLERTTPVPVWIAAALVLVVGVSRVYLGTHYVADVLAGAALGVLIAWVWLRFGARFADRAARLPFGAWVGACGVALGVAVASLVLSGGGHRFLWNGAALVGAAALALPLEWRLVRYAPPSDPGSRLRACVLGLAVLIPLMIGGLASPHVPLAFGAGMLALATVWVLLGAPAVFVRLGLAGEAEGRPERAARRTATATVATGVVLGVVALYGAAIEPRLLLEVRRETACLPRLPASLDGTRVALTGDFQLGMWADNDGMVGRAVARIAAERPDLVLFTGDFVYRPGDDPGEEAREVVDALAPLVRSGIPAFAVLGNHDWALETPRQTPDTASARWVAEALERSGVTLLRNESAPLSVGGTTGDSLWVVGLGSRYAGDDRPDRALSGVRAESPRIVLMHHPDSHAAIPAGAAPLALAGHTHGGQVRLPFLPEWSWLRFTADDAVHADGWIVPSHGEPGNRLYVNRGVGFSVLPVRVFARPEVTLLTLRSPATAQSDCPVPL